MVLAASRRQRLVFDLFVFDIRIAATSRNLYIPKASDKNNQQCAQSHQSGNAAELNMRPQKPTTTSEAAMAAQPQLVAHFRFQQPEGPRLCSATARRVSINEPCMTSANQNQWAGSSKALE